MIVDGLLDSSIALAVNVIRSGGLVGLPTETVYGLGADAENDAAVAQIFKAKGRPAGHPLSVLVANVSCVAHFAAEVPDFAAQLIKAFWPGPLTLILPRRPGVASAAADGQDSIGLRCPSHPVAQVLLKALNGGLAAPSANQFGRVSPTTAQHVLEEFGDDLMILDGGACSVGIESTIIDCTRGAPVLLRPGAITPAQVQAVCGFRVLQNDELPRYAKDALKSPGTLKSHYAPRAKVRLLDALAIQTALREETDVTVPIGATRKPASSRSIARVAVWSRSAPGVCQTGVLWRAMPNDATAAAQQLFAVLRELDAQGASQIFVETVPAGIEWNSVRDRLQRASAS